MIYKKRTKIFHEKHIMRRNFEVGQQVLPYNSHIKLFLGKLKSKWLDPFIVHKVFVNGVVELHDPKDTYTLMVNGQRLEVYA